MPDGYDLRPLEAGDAAALAEAHTRNREHLGPWEPRRPPGWGTEEGMAAVVRSQLTAVENGYAESWVLWHGADVVGRGNLQNIVRGAMQGGTLGYWVDGGHLRRGLASAVVAFLVERGVAIALHRIEAGTIVENTPSQGVLVRNGFEQYGLVPRFLHIDGEWRDHLLFQRILHDGPPRGPAAPTRFPPP